MIYTFMLIGSHTSDLFYFGGSYVGVFLFYLVFGHLDEVTFAFVVLWQTVGIAV